MCERLLIVGDEAVFHVAVVGEVEGGVEEKVVVKLLPSVLNEGDGHVAEGR